MTPGAGSGRCVTLETVDWEVCCPGDCGHVTPAAGSGDCVGLTTRTWVGILYAETSYVLFASVCLACSEISSLGTAGVAWLTCGPFSSLRVAAFT